MAANDSVGRPRTNNLFVGTMDIGFYFQDNCFLVLKSVLCAKRVQTRILYRYCASKIGNLLAIHSYDYVEIAK